MKASQKILIVFLTTLTISCAASVPIVPVYEAPVAPTRPTLGLWDAGDGNFCMTEESVRDLWQHFRDDEAYNEAVKETIK